MPFEPVQFGKYTLYEKLAVGGMALLYRARIQGVKGFQKDLVIKQILPQYSGMNDFIDMFIDEAKIAVNLNHANIVPVYELGEIDGQLYIAMEYVAGKDLQAILEACEDKKTTVPPRIAAYLLMGACRGLDYAHNKKDDATRQPLNIIHRDISPNNVIVSWEGEVKIIDFGIAKASIKVSVTQFGTLKGKMIYMSPEQAAEQKLDPRSDVFSAGILLYELVTGKKPYGGDNFAVTQENVKKAVFPAPDKVNPSLPPAMVQIILKAMARDPAERFQSAFDFERALTDYLFSTGQNVYARDVAAFLQDLFAERTDEKLVESRGTKSGVKNLTDPGDPKVPTEPRLGSDTQPRLASGSLTPTSESSVEKPIAGEWTGETSPSPRSARAAAAAEDDPGSRLPKDDGLPTDAPVPSEEPAGDGTSGGLIASLDEGPAIDEGAEEDGDAVPEPAPKPARAILGEESFDFEIPPPPAPTPAQPSQRETVVTRRPPSRAPTAPPESAPTPPPVAGRGGVVPSAGRGDGTRTNPSPGRDDRTVIGELPAETTAGGSGADDLAGVVPERNVDEETAPGAPARATPAPVLARGAAAPAPAPPRPTSPPATPARSPRDVTPARPTPAPRGAAAVVPPRPAIAETPVSPPGGRPNPLGTVPPVPVNAPTPPASAPPPTARPAASTPSRGTPAPPWQSAPASAPVSPEQQAKRGLLERIVGRRPPPAGAAPAVPPAAGNTPVGEPLGALEGFYESPQDFLQNHYATYGGADHRGLFLSTTQLDAKLGVDIPLRLQFANPPSSFLVHGRVIWRRAKEGTSKGKRLPAGLAIEFVEELPDDLVALYAYLGLP